MLETRTSPGSAHAATRDAMCTASPPRSAPRTSTSPVCTPARICNPRDRTASAAASAHRTADTGRSNDREEPIPRRRDLASAEALELGTHERVMLIEEVPPPTIAHLGREARRVHDVGEQQRGEHPIGVGAGPRAVRNSSTSSSSSSMPSENARWSVPGSSTISGAGIAAAARAGILRRNDPVAAPVQHERRRADRRQDVGHVGLHRLAVVVAERAGPDRERWRRASCCAKAASSTRLGARNSTPLSSATALASISSITSSIDSIGSPAASVCAGVSVNSTSERHSSGYAAASRTATIVPSLSPMTAVPPRPRRVEYREGVPDLRLQIRQLVERDRIRQTRASAIEVDQPTEGAQPPQEPREVGEVPDRLDVVHPRVDEEDVQRPSPDRLVGEMDVAVPRVPGLGTLGHAGFHRR